jgi:uncharacterized protein (DUF1778 family)
VQLFPNCSLREQDILFTLERLEARVTSRQKALLRRAAAIRGRSLTDLVVSAAEEAAEQVIRSEFVISLGAKDSATFVSALLLLRSRIAL